MDKRKFNGGSRKGAGRKKGTGISNKINKAVNDFMDNLLEDEEIKKQALKEAKQLSLQSGWIYIIKDVDTGYYKIGVTQRKNPKQRFTLYKSHNMNISLTYLNKVDYCFEIENDLHALLKRINKGDWYKITDTELVNAISKISEHKYSNVFKDY